MKGSQGTVPPSDLKALSSSVSFNGWRTASSAFKSWAIKMSSSHKPTWQKAGIFQAVMASTKGFDKNTDLLLSIAERWCPDTNTFVFPWGEATVTLEDVMVLLGLSVLGSPVFASLDSSGEKILRELEKEWLKIKKDRVNSSVITQVAWIKRFMDSGDELEHVAFLVLWLSYFVFPSRYYHMDEAVLPIAVHLSCGSKIALAPAVLAHLYSDLTLLKDHTRAFTRSKSIDKVELNALFRLLQAWTWERFRELWPKHTNPLLKGEPRLALWDSKQNRTKSNVRKRTNSNVRKVLAYSKMDMFEWRPYTKAVKNWKLPKFYPEKAKWVSVGPDLDEEFISFARCIKVSELVGMDSVEHYFPNRVASQFGLLQDVPCPIVNRKKHSKKEAWSDYNKPIEDLTLFIPSRSAISCFTSMFCEWWRKDRLGESLTPRNIIGGDDDTSENVPSGSKKRKSMKRVCKDNETQTQVPSEKDEEDDNLTIAQVMRLRKKNTSAMCSSDENPPKVVPLREVLQKLGNEIPEKLKRSRYLSGGSASREVPLSELFQKEVVKSKSEHLGDKRTRENDDEKCMDCYDNINTAEMIMDKEKGLKGVRDVSESLGKRNNRIERDNKDSWMCQKLVHEDETGNKAGRKNMVLSSANGNNSSDPSLGANREVADIVASRPKTRQNCDDDVGVIGIINTEKKKTAIVGDGTKEAKCLLHEDGENQRSSNEKEDDGESLKQINLSIEEIALNLDARMMKVEKTLAKIREWKTIERNQGKNGISA